MKNASAGLTRRALLGAGLSGAAAMSLAACSAGASTGSSGPSTSKSLSLMLFGPTQQMIDWLNSTALPAFKKKTGLAVEIRQSQWGTGFQKLLTAAASNTLADVTMLGEVMTPALAARNAFLPIDSYLSKWSDTNAFYPAMLKDGMYGGKSYAVPVYADVRTTLYRKDILAQGGIPTASIPKTWDEFKAAAEKLSKSKGGPSGTPVFWGQDNSVGLMQTFAQLLYQAGGSFFDASGKSNLSSPEGKKALEYLVSFYKEGLANASVVYSLTGPTPLVQGISAMTYSGESEFQNARNNAPAVQSKLFAGPPLASAQGTPSTTMAWINKLAISAKTNNREGAWELLSFLASKDNADSYAKLYGGLPTRTDLASSPYAKTISPNLIAASSVAKALPTNKNLLTIQQQVNIAMQAAIRLTVSPQQTLAQLDSKIDQINGK